MVLIIRRFIETMELTHHQSMRLMDSLFFLRVQKKGETTIDSLTSLKKGAKTKGKCIKILIKTSAESVDLSGYVEGVSIIPSTSCPFYNFF